MKTILIVDDDYELVENVAAFLSSEGFRVVTAANGKHGLTRLKSERPDLVLTDFLMPTAGGGDLVRTMRQSETLRAKPVIMMSATDRRIVLADETLELAGFIKKPFTCEQLLTQVVRVIGAPERGDALEDDEVGGTSRPSRLSRESPRP